MRFDKMADDLSFKRGRESQRNGPLSKNKPQTNVNVLTH